MLCFTQYCKTKPELTGLTCFVLCTDCVRDCKLHWARSSSESRHGKKKKKKKSKKHSKKKKKDKKKKDSSFFEHFKRE